MKNAPPDWDSQFFEEPDERRERWRRLKAIRRSMGCCWQCAKPLTGGLCENPTCGAKQ